MRITMLGQPSFTSPLTRTVSDTARVPLDLIRDDGITPSGIEFELAGPRERLFFDPAQVTAGIVTCGGLCPGLNNVIRSLFLEMYHIYGVPTVLGFRGGYQGLDSRCGIEPITLSCESVDDIHRSGGTILGTSRGPVDVAVAVDNLLRRKVSILFTIGGDGTQRGAHELYELARKRGHALSVVGIPKTIDNDVAFVSRSFGYLSAVEAAVVILQCAHTEAHSVQNGISIVKLMGRHAGFIAAAATVASQDVNFTLVPEVPIQLHGPRGFLETLKKRIQRRAHALIVVAEGAGQDLLVDSSTSRDASGNVQLQDIGPFLRQTIETYFREQQIPVTLRYFDPSYTIRSVPADSEDALVCDMFARNAVHAAMAGKTGLVIGLVHDQFVHVPIEMLTAHRKRMDPDDTLWRAVLASTGQPERFGG
jgi:6-phosphofructokinase 1